MARFSRTPIAPTSPITTTGATTTLVGGAGILRDVKSELFLLAAAMLAGDTFYERAEDRDQRLCELTAAATVTDPDWVAQFVPYLRGTMNLRSAAVMVAAESVLARRGDTDREATIPVRKMVADSMLRADEPAEFIAYWRQRTGRRTLPGGVQRGVADAVQRLYTERAALKWDGVAGLWRMGDVVELAHPEPKSAAQSDLFTYLLDRRHHPREIRASLDRLPILSAYRNAMAMAERERYDWFLQDPARIGAAGLTWEALSAWGPMDAAAWTAMIPNMYLTALVRNLRNFDEQGVDDDTARLVCSKLMDPKEVQAARLLPFQIWAAYKHTTTLRWGHALETALNASLANVPALPGRTLILVDRSPSMFPGYPFSTPNKSDITLAEQAAVFGAALALRAADPTLVEFGGQTRRLDVARGGSILRLIERFGQHDGTDIPSAVRGYYAGHDRIIVVTDEQTRQGWLPSNMVGHGGMPATEIDDLVPKDVPLYMWNMAGYRPGATRSGGNNRHTLGGLSDDAFRLLPMLDAGRDARWPWES